MRVFYLSGEEVVEGVAEYYDSDKRVVFASSKAGLMLRLKLDQVGFHKSRIGRLKPNKIDRMLRAGGLEKPPHALFGLSEGDLKES